MYWVSSANMPTWFTTWTKFCSVFFPEVSSWKKNHRSIAYRLMIHRCKQGLSSFCSYRLYPSMDQAMKTPSIVLQGCMTINGKFDRFFSSIWLLK
jgi:hypothetical protein